MNGGIAILKVNVIEDKIPKKTKLIRIEIEEAALSLLNKKLRAYVNGIAPNGNKHSITMDASNLRSKAANKIIATMIERYILSKSKMKVPTQ
jgi:hypothetical protein